MELFCKFAPFNPEIFASNCATCWPAANQQEIMTGTDRLPLEHDSMDVSHVSVWLAVLSAKIWPSYWAKGRLQPWYPGTLELLTPETLLAEYENSDTASFCMVPKRIALHASRLQATTRHVSSSSQSRSSSGWPCMCHRRGNAKKTT